MKFNIFHPLLTTISLLLVVAVNSASGFAKPLTVKFVTKVSKNCKHVGSVREVFDNAKVFGEWGPRKNKVSLGGVKKGHEVFTASMKKNAAAKGANRLVIKDVDYEMTTSSGGGISYELHRTLIRARAFYCPH